MENKTRSEKIELATRELREQIEQHIKMISEGGLRKPIIAPGIGGGKYIPKVVTGAVDIESPYFVHFGYMEREDYSEFEYWFNEPLVVIGEAYRRNMNMFMSESGKIYGEYGGYQLFKFGENIYEALEALCIPKPIEEIKNPSLP